MIIKGEHKTKQEADFALELFQRGKRKGAYRIIKNECGGEKKAFPFLIQMRIKKEWLCLHD